MSHAHHYISLGPESCFMLEGYLAPYSVDHRQCGRYLVQGSDTYDRNLISFGLRRWLMT